jgi:hypothetical protein
MQEISDFCYDQLWFASRAITILGSGDFFVSSANSSYYRVVRRGETQFGFFSESRFRARWALENPLTFKTPGCVALPERPG